MTMPALLLALQLAIPTPEPAHGATLGGTLEMLALAAIVLGVIGLVLVEFVWKNRLAQTTYRWVLLLGLLVLPAFALTGATGSMFEEMKTVQACNSCHVMNEFVDDMSDPSSATLAARHYRTGAIPAKQCYSCHTGYGIFGTVEAKRDGFRHWLLYVTRTWEEPLTYKGSYPNDNCLACHSASPEFREVASHAALREPLAGDEMGCFTCHGLPHPSRAERAGNDERGGSTARVERPGSVLHAEGTDSARGPAVPHDTRSPE